MIHTVKGFGIINKAEVDVFFWDSLTFLMTQLIIQPEINQCGSSAFLKSNLNIIKFTVYTLLKPGLSNFEHYFANMWDEYSCAVVWAFFVIAFLWDWNEKWTFPVLWPLLNKHKQDVGADCGWDHELFIAIFRLKLKKVGKTTRPFKYDLNQIPYDYIVEVRNIFKG